MYYRNKLQGYSERNHGWLHLFFGLVIGLVAMIFGRYNFHLLILSLVGAFLPDIDHLFYIFIYGRSSEYSQEIRRKLKINIFEAVGYIKKNHKNNTKILSHNVISLFAVMVVAVWSYTVGRLEIATLFASWSMHYVFDMLEDVLFFGKLNGNWLFRYGAKRES